MEYLEVIITDGTRNRIERIKQLRKESVGMIVSDQDVITAAIACYWQAAEIRALCDVLTKNSKNEQQRKRSK